MAGVTAPQPLPRLHVCGDSISMQYGPYLERMLAGIAGYSRKSGKQGDLDRAQGANGGDSGMVLAYLRELTTSAAEPFALLLLNCGLHDIKTSGQPPRHQVEPDPYRANLTVIAELAPRLARRLAWIRTTPVDDALHAQRCTAGFGRVDADVERYNAIADEVMRGAGARLIDLNGFTRALGRADRAGDAEIFCDHVHFTEAVRAQQAAFIAGQVAALLGNPR